MALVFDNRHNLQPGEPGIHALIAGVSYYRHLPGGSGPPAENDWGLPQLSATALTGYKMFRWLIDHRKQLPKKLATVRLLLSPSAAEAPKISAGMAEITQALAGEGVTLVDTPSLCTLDNFAGEARRWRKDAISDIDDSNVTFFYFAGHGIQRKNNDPVLLLEDQTRSELRFPAGRWRPLILTRIAVRCGQVSTTSKRRSLIHHNRRQCRESAIPKKPAPDLSGHRRLRALATW